ncbi:FecR family protein [Pedobacter frigoris]|uniref:FecR family protein n=1 Tax=Pedobacter frigoris TaxID=2571272 RepID=A0A4U1CUH5_9SPHI|nr:FecR family protein [Pedobacter frigoris]TKC09428.1 FecR family protein [Pedobacter frigoris]
MNTKLDYLYQRYVDETCTEEERAELFSIIAANSDEPQIATLLDGTWNKINISEFQAPENAEDMLAEILTQHKRSPVKKIKWYRYAAAASVVIALSAALYFYKSNKPALDQNTETLSDIGPGSNKATLTLANGKVIYLDSVGSGSIAQQAGIEITKTKDGRLVYNIVSSTKSDTKTDPVYNTVITPRGGQYQINLPDGTKIWLNAASSLKYPTAFNGNKRRVELSGEAYFEVAKDEKHPFIVATDKQEVQVLGTHFNVNSYADEGVTKTTLLEGAVRVSQVGIGKTTTLLPGQQSILDNNNLTTRIVDTQESIAWKDGYFQFNESDLGSIMKQLSRWYDIDVVFESKPATDLFHFKIQRNLNLNEVMNLLEINGINVKKEGRTLIVK